MAKSGYAVNGSTKPGRKYSATMPIMLVGIIVAIVNPPPINAPLRAVLPSLAAKTLSIKSKATMSPRPNAKIPAQLTSAPLPISVRPERSRYEGGALPMIVLKSTPENPAAKNMNAAQNAPIAR